MLAHFIQNSAPLKVTYNLFVGILLKQAIESLRKQRMNSIFTDIVFALNKSNEEIILTESIRIAKESINNLTTSKFGKLLVFLKNNEFVYSQLIIQYEEKLNADLLSPKTPDLWFAISQSDKIINSNLGKEIDNKVLETLESGTSTWKTLIKDIRKEGITINLGSGIEIPQFSVLDDYVNIFCLKKLERDYSVQLSINDNDDFSLFKQLNQKKLITDLSSINILLIFTFISLMIIFLTIELNGAEYSVYFQKLITGKINPETIVEIFAYLSNPLVIIGIVFWWYINIYRTFKKTTILSFKKIWILNPVVLIISKIFQIK